MANFFRDFMNPAKIIFDRLKEQNNKKVIVNGTNGNHSSNVIPPYYPELPEYPCKLIRGSDGKINSIEYGLNANGSCVWKQIIVRGSDGKINKMVQKNPDGDLEIVFNRDSLDKVNIIDIQ